MLKGHHLTLKMLATAVVEGRGHHPAGAACCLPSLKPRPGHPLLIAGVRLLSTGGYCLYLENYFEENGVP